MNKELKFSSNLVGLILDGSKTATWRIDDDKDITEGDQLNLLERAGEDIKQFATARVLRVIEKPFGSLTYEDKEGHEPFKSDQAMYETFINYYQKPVGPETRVKIAWFELI